MSVVAGKRMEYIGLFRKQTNKAIFKGSTQYLSLSCNSLNEMNVSATFHCTQPARWSRCLRLGGEAMMTLPGRFSNCRCCSSLLLPPSLLLSTLSFTLSTHHPHHPLLDPVTSIHIPSLRIFNIDLTIRTREPYRPTPSVDTAGSHPDGSARRLRQRLLET